MSRHRPVVLARDHARPRTPPAPTTHAMEDHLTTLIQPAIFAQADAYRRLGLRDRVLALPAMTAMVLTLIWRQVPSVSDLVRLLAREGILWTPALVVSQQAVSLRLRSLPASLFAGIWTDLAPCLQARAAARTRPVPPIVAQVHPHFPRVWALDGSTLEAVFKRVGLLRGRPDTVLGGTIEAVLDLATKLPVQVWFDPEAVGNDLRFRPHLHALLPAHTLVVMDAGYWAYPFFDWLTEHQVGFVIRARAVRAEVPVTTLHTSPLVHDRIVRVGSRSRPCRHPIRLVAVQTDAGWQTLATNVLDPAILSTAAVVDLYAQRWRVEEALLVTKRLLGLSYLWTGAVNGIALQVWASWLLYAVLVDLTDAVAEAMGQPLAAMSLEMTYRGLYHFTRAYQRGEADDPVAYLAAQPDLGLVKRRRPARDRLHAARDAWRSELNL